MLSVEFRRTVAQGEAERFWRLYGFSTPDELVLEELAFARGVIVIEGPLDGMEARLVRDGERGLVRIKDHASGRGRKRFAVAHELGHWELHQDVSQVFACTSQDMVASYKDSPEEGQANHFAACLLMPSHLFLEHVQDQVLSFDILGETKEYFGTSLTATAIRFTELSDDYCAVVVAEEGRIRWWRGSAAFEARFWLPYGARLSRNTVAASLMGRERDRAGPEEVDIDAWSKRTPDEDSQVFIEESVYMKSYRQLMSLLRLP